MILPANLFLAWMRTLDQRARLDIAHPRPRPAIFEHRFGNAGSALRAMKAIFYSSGVIRGGLVCWRKGRAIYLLAYNAYPLPLAPHPKTKQYQYLSE